MQQPCHYQNRLKVRAGRSGVLRVLLDRTDGSIACVGVVESDFLISYATTLGVGHWLSNAQSKDNAKRHVNILAPPPQIYLHPGTVAASCRLNSHELRELLASIRRDFVADNIRKPCWAGFGHEAGNSRWAVESFFSALKRTMGSTLTSRKPSQLLAEAAFKVLAYTLRR